MKIKTSELQGPALDWAVAKCEGWDAPIYKNPGRAVPLYVATNDTGLFTYSPSTNWTQGGPIIEQQRLFVRPKTTGGWRCWFYDGKGEGIKFDQHGSTPLIAAMRCFVSSRLGDELEIPDDLH